MAWDLVGAIADFAGATAFISWARTLPFLDKLFLVKVHTDTATVHERKCKIKRKRALCREQSDDKDARESVIFEP
jgi:hypothetical protein